MDVSDCGWLRRSHSLYLPNKAALQGISTWFMHLVACSPQHQLYVPACGCQQHQ